LLFSYGWLHYALSGNLRSAINPIATYRWMRSNPGLWFHSMISFGLVGVLLGVLGRLTAALQG
jgi:hypothetical protein